MEIESLLLGASTFEAGRPRRVPAVVTERWAADTIEAARVPAGIRLAFTGTARRIDIDVETSAALALATPAEHGEFTVYVGGEKRHSVPVAESTTTTVRIELPERDAAERVEIHLPERYEPRIMGVRGVDGEIQSVAPAKKWVAYGDSITQGWTTTDPGGAWAAIAARATGLDLLNLGFAGAARGELPVAAHLSSVPADVISLSWGTNCWAQIEMDAAYISELMRLFLATVRRGHPETPILVLSPVIRPAAEDARNSSGATLAELRDALEGAVTRYREQHADEHLHLLPGGALIGADELDPDGIHPNDAGHAAIGAAVASALEKLL